MDKIISQAIKLKTLIKFGIVGFVGFIINYGVLTIVNDGLKNHVESEIIAALVALQITFILHDKWTYKDKTKYSLPFLKRYFAYLASSSFGSILTVFFYSIFYYQFKSIIALFLAALVGVLWNYILNAVLIWKHKNQEIVKPED